jgi:hypothetical protein
MDEHDQKVTEEERHASEHQRFMQRLHMRELAQKKAWAKQNQEYDEEEEEAQKETSLSQKEETSLDGMPAQSNNDSEPAEDPAKAEEEKEFEQSVEEETKE